MAGGCICGICLGLWCALAGSTCQCVGWVFADVHWGMSMYTESHCVALDYNLVDLWFLSLHCCFLLCIGGYTGGCAWWWVVHSGVHRVFSCFYSFLFAYLCFFWVLWLWFLVVHGASFLLWIMFLAIYLVLSS